MEHNITIKVIMPQIKMQRTARQRLGQEETRQEWIQYMEGMLFTHARRGSDRMGKLQRKFDGKNYDYVGGGPKANVEKRKKGWLKKGYSVRTIKSGRARRLYVRKN